MNNYSLREKHNKGFGVKKRTKKKRQNRIRWTRKVHQDVEGEGGERGGGERR